jgi:hypothetical protein
MYPFDLADPMKAVQQNVDPFITSLVVGSPVRRTWPSAQILRNILVPNWTFQWGKYGFESFVRRDTERAMRAEIRTSDFEMTFEAGKLRRFTHALKRDRDELANASPSFRLRELLALHARRIVRYDIESIIATMLTTTTNYPVSHRLAIAGGAEWDSAGGDSRADIRSMAAAIAADSGVSYEDVVVWLSESSLNAALSDPIFIEARRNFNTDTPGKDALAKYWGIKEIRTSNPITYSLAGAPSAMYGDVAILFVESVGSDWDTEYGEFDFAVNFRWNKGTALQAFYEDKTTSWWFPWQEYASPKIINNKLAAIITNTAA